MSGKRKMVQMNDLSDLRQAMKPGKKQNRGDKRDRNHIYERRTIIMQFLDMQRECDVLADKALILRDLEKKGYGTSKRTLERDIASIKATHSGRILARRTYNKKFGSCAKYLKLIGFECNKIVAESNRSIRVATIIVDSGGEKIIEESSSQSQLAYMQLRAIDHRLRSVKIMLKLLGGGDIDVCLSKLKSEFEEVSLEREQMTSKVKKLVEKYAGPTNIPKVAKGHCIDPMIKT